MYDISATGFSALIKASKTFPGGFLVSAFADDQDTFDLPVVNAAESAMDINGNLISWSTPEPAQLTISVIAGSPADNNLSILLDANTASKGRRHAGDVITIIGSYPDYSTVTARNGKILSGPRGKSVASAGRIKSNSYVFAFESFDQTRA
jgi:hypothetical protein